jgi:hypothetical protein
LRLFLETMRPKTVEHPRSIGQASVSVNAMGV